MNYKAANHGFVPYRRSGMNFRRSGPVRSPHIVNQQQKMDQAHPYTSFFVSSNGTSAVNPPEKSRWQRFLDTFDFREWIKEAVDAIIGPFIDLGATAACMCCIFLTVIIGNAITIALTVAVTVKLYDGCCPSCHNTAAIVPTSTLMTNIVTTAVGLINETESTVISNYSIGIALSNSSDSGVLQGLFNSFNNP